MEKIKTKVIIELAYKEPFNVMKLRKAIENILDINDNTEYAIYQEVE